MSIFDVRLPTMELPNLSHEVCTVAQNIKSDFEAKKENILKRAITLRLGEGWTVDQLKGRCYTTKSPSTDEVFYLDGQPLVVFSEPVFQLDFNNVMKVSINYRLMGENMGDNTESGSLSPFLQKELEAHYSGEENFRKMYMCTFPAEDDLKKEWIAKFACYLGWQPDELPQDVLALGIRQYDAKNGLSHAIEVVKRQLRMPPYHDA